jgi:hypothetical protein
MSKPSKKNKKKRKSKKAKKAKKTMAPAAHAARQTRTEIREKARVAAAEAKQRALQVELQAGLETHEREVAARAIASTVGKAATEGRDASTLAASAQVEARQAMQAALEASVAEVQQQLRNLEARFHGQVRQDRKKRSDPSAALASALTQLEEIEKAIDVSKAEAETCKRKITEWKSWYDAQPEAEKSSAWTKLIDERTRLAEKLTTQESWRTELESKKLAAAGEVEAALAQLAARESGALDRPLEEDPRLSGLEMARAELESQLREAETALADFLASENE